MTRRTVEKLTNFNNRPSALTIYFQLLQTYFKHNTAFPILPNDANYFSCLDPKDSFYFISNTPYLSIIEESPTCAKIHVAEPSDESVAINSAIVFIAAAYIAQEIQKIATNRFKPNTAETIIMATGIEIIDANIL